MQRSLLYVLIAFLLTLVRVGVKVAAASLDINDNDLGEFRDGVLDPRKEETKSFEVSLTNEHDVRHLGNVIDALEELGVLSASRENCYTLVDIVRTTSETDKQTGSRKVSVAINLRELEQRRIKQPSHSGDDVLPDAVTLPSVSDQLTSEFTPSPQGGSAGSEGGRKECIFRGDAGWDAGEAEWRSAEVNDTNSGNDQQNQTVPPIGGVSKTKNKKVSPTDYYYYEAGREVDSITTMDGMNGTERTELPPENNSHRLSKTQVLVISTCSVVIGLFFIVAVMIRVNNYIKRTREEQAAARRPSFRSTSFSLNSTANSHLNANSVKDGRLEAALNKDGGDCVAMVIKDEDDDGDITPRMSSQENRPLLIVTAASAPSSPCPQRARTDYQYSNGQDDAAMTADEMSGNGGYGVARSSSSNYQADETPPAPRSQRLNRFHNNLSYTRVGGGVHQVPVSLQEEDDSGAESEEGEPHSIGEQLGHVNHALGPISPTEEEARSTISNPQVKSSEQKNQHAKAERLLSFGSTDRECLDDGGSTDSPKMVEWDVYDSFSEDSYQKHSLDIEYQAVGANRPGEPALSAIPEGVDIDGVGYTQSDSSISSNNPSYRYGNQAEYTGVQQYPNVEYVPQTIPATAASSSANSLVPSSRNLTENSKRTVSPNIPRPMLSQESTDSNVVVRQVSDDSLLYNDSPNLLRRNTSQVQGSSVEEEERQDFWLEEEADDVETSPNDRFSFQNDRFNFRDDRLPNILEDEGGPDHHNNNNAEGFQRRNRKSLTMKMGSLPRQKQSIRDDAPLEPTDNSDSDPVAMLPVARGRVTQVNGELGSRSSDSDTSETVSTNLLPPQQPNRNRKKRHRRQRHSPGWSLLQDPEFEGMEPTYV